MTKAAPWLEEEIKWARKVIDGLPKWKREMLDYSSRLAAVKAQHTRADTEEWGAGPFPPRYRKARANWVGQYVMTTQGPGVIRVNINGRRDHWMVDLLSGGELEVYREPLPPLVD